MREQAILDEVVSIKDFVGRACRKGWENFTMTYSPVSKEELIRKMRKALRNMIFNPPIQEYKFDWESSHE